MSKFDNSGSANLPESGNSGLLGTVEQQIIVLLRANGRATTAELARTIGVTEATIRRKLRRLTEDRAITVKAVIDPLRLGKNVAVIVGLDVERKHIESVARALAAYDFVEWVYATTGPFHLMAELTIDSSADLYGFLLNQLSNVEGIKNTESFMIIQTFKHNGVVNSAGMQNSAVQHNQNSGRVGS